jgi:hypothetical protein
LVSFEPWPFPNPSLAGHATVDFNGWIVPKIPIFRRRDDGLSAGSPSCPLLDGEGRQRVGEDGKPQYRPVITFGSREDKARYEKLVLTALADAGVQP